MEELSAATDAYLAGSIVNGDREKRARPDEAAQSLARRRHRHARAHPDRRVSLLPRSPQLSPRGILFELAVVFTLTIIVPVTVSVVIVRMLVARTRQRLYSRLGNGRHVVSGVCAGIAEATGISVMSLRIAFLALLFLKGLGLLIYLGFDLAMQIHPADREHLRRLRIRRAFAATLARVRGAVTE